MKTVLTTLAAFALLFAATSTHAAIVFSDDFEDPNGDPDGTNLNVSAAQSDGFTNGKIDTTKWVMGTNGYGSDRQGIVDESHGDFTDPVGEQAYAFRYTNSGITSIAGAIGDLTAGYTYTVSFDVVLDGHDNATPWEAALVTFATTANGDRDDIAGGIANDTTAVLATSKADGDGDPLTNPLDTDNTILVGTTYQTITFSYTADGTEGTLGQDVAIRFDGATSTAIIDNVSVDVVVPEPGSLALMGLGGLLMLKRRKRA